MKTRTSLMLLTLAVLGLLAVQSAQAATYTWDVETDDEAITDGTTGAWQVGVGNWYDGTNYDQVWADGNAAVFGTGAAGTGGTVTITGDVKPTDITLNKAFDNTSYSLSGGRILFTGNGATMNVNVAADATSTIATGIGSDDFLNGGTGDNNLRYSVGAGATLTSTGDNYANAIVNGVDQGGTMYFNGGGTINLQGMNRAMANKVGGAGIYARGPSFIGDTSAGNTVNVEGASGKLWVSTLRIGMGANGDNTLNITSPGILDNPSVWCMGNVENDAAYTGAAVLGDSSSNNTINIAAGAYLKANDKGFIIGGQTGSNNNTMIVEGSFNRGTNNYLLDIGHSGDSNSMIVQNGGWVSTGRFGIGTKGGNDNFTQVTGPTSKIEYNDQVFFTIGGENSGAVGGDRNYLLVEAAGTADFGNSTYGGGYGVGIVDNSDDNYIEVTGVGSYFRLKQGQPLSIGGQTGENKNSHFITDRDNTGNYMKVVDGATADLNSLYIMGNSTGDGAKTAGKFILGEGGSNTSQATFARSTGDAMYVSGVTLYNAGTRMEMNNGRLLAGVDGAMVSGPGQVNLLGPAYFSTTFAESSIDSVIAGTGTLTKEESGTLTLSTANTYSGDTKIDAGALKLGNNLAIQNSALDTSAQGALDVTTTNTPMFGGLLGGNNLQMPANVTALTLNPGTGVTKTYSGILGSAAAGMTLTKTGAGTQVLSGANLYSGGTTVSNGTLRVNNTTGSGTGTGAVTVNSGATLGGTGAISGAVTINAGGRYAPGMSVGTQSVGSLTLAAGSLLDFEFETTSPYTHDLAAVTGTLTLSGGTINLYNAGTTTAFTTNGTYHLFSYGLLSGSTTNLSVDDTSKQYTFGITTGGTKYVNVTIADLNASLLTFPSGTATLLMLKNGSGTPVASTVTNTSAVAGNYAVAGTAGADALTLYPDTGTVDAYGTEDFGFGWASTATSGSRTGAITLTNTSNTSDTGGNKTINVTGVVGNATADMTNSPGAFGTPLTAPVAWGESYANLESQVTGAVGSGGEAPVGSTATILAGINEGFVTPTSPATVSMAWRTRTTTETSLASDVVNLTGMDDGYGQTDYFLLQMTYHPDLLFGDENSLASDGKIYLAWLDTGTTLWTNAGDTATYAVVVGLWSDYVTPGDLSGDLGRWGVNDASHTAWAVVDHNSQFAVVGPEPPIPGDANLDHVVNALDYVVVSNHYGVGSTWAEGDVNGDGVVNALDYVVISNHYGAHAPEPATLALLGLGGLGLILRRKRR